jgi:hypothetical protein
MGAAFQWPLVRKAANMVLGTAVIGPCDMPVSPAYRQKMARFGTAFAVVALLAVAAQAQSSAGKITA